MTEPTAWLVRAGQRSRHAGLFAENGLVALGWADVEGLDDLSALPAGTVRARLLQAPHITAPEQDAAELLAFRDEIRVGDIVITPDAPVREILIGEITGRYEFRDPSPVGDYRHVRTVRWYGRLERDLLPDELGRETNWRRTIRRLGHQARWRSVAARVAAGDGRDVRSAAGVHPTGPHGGRPPAGLRGRACGSCGLVKAAGQYEAGDDRCVDCR